MVGADDRFPLGNVLPAKDLEWGAEGHNGKDKLADQVDQLVKAQ